MSTVQGNRSHPNEMLNMNIPTQQQHQGGSHNLQLPRQYSMQSDVHGPRQQIQLQQVPNQQTNRIQYKSVPRPSTTYNISIQDTMKLKLNKYIHDYLRRNNYINTASTFEQESKMDLNSSNIQDISSMGFLFEWWCLHWDINGNRLNRSSANTPQYVEVKDMRSGGGFYPPGNTPNQMDSNNSKVLTPSSNNVERTDPLNEFPSSPPLSHVSQQPNSMRQYIQNKPENELMYSRSMIPHGNMPIHGDQQNIPMNIQNRQPPHFHQQTGGQTGQVMMTNPQVHSGYNNHYFQNKGGISSPGTISSPSGTTTRVPNIPSPQNYVMSSYPQQEISPPTRRSTVNETKAKTTSKKTRVKVKKEIPQSPTYISHPLTPIQESHPFNDHSQIYQSSNIPSEYPGTKKRSPPTDYTQYSTPPHSEYFNNTSYSEQNITQPSHSYPQNSSDGGNVHPNLKKVKSSDIQDNSVLEGIEQSKRNPEIDTSDIDCLNQINDKDLEAQSLILNSIDNSNDLLDNFDDNPKGLCRSLIEHTRYNLDEPNNKIFCCNFNNTGTLLAAGTSKTIYIWDLYNGCLKTKLDNGVFNVTGLSFSPNKSNILVSSSLDGTIRIWDCDKPYSNSSGSNNFQCIKIFKPKEHGAIHSVDFHPSKSNIICSSETSGCLRFWDVNQDDCVAFIKDAATKQARFSPNGRLLATGESNVIKIFDVETTHMLKQLTGHIKPIQSVYWGENENTIISASEDSVKVWKLGSSTECIGSFTPPGNKNYYAIPHPQHVNSELVIGTYKSVYVWDYSLTRQLNNYDEIKAHDGIVSSLCSYGGTLLASTSHDSSVKLWNITE